ncbi:MAG TPA: hypothetical protein VIK74_09005 [Parasegetibacter sp.]|jgi:hypothetical protein
MQRFLFLLIAVFGWQVAFPCDQQQQPQPGQVKQPAPGSVEKPGSSTEKNDSIPKKVTVTKEVVEKKATKEKEEEDFDFIIHPFNRLQRVWK